MPVALNRSKRFHRQVEIAAEGQNIFVEQRHSGLGLLGDMQQAKGLTAIAIDHRMQVDLADTFEVAVAPPPLNWSSAMFRKTEERDGQQATEARRDCQEVTAG